MSDGGGGFLAIAFFGIGLLLFFRGFRSYRRYRLLADTPRVRARAAAMGLVEVEGLTKSTGEMIASPVSGIPCLYYQVEIEAEKIDKDGRITWGRAVKDAKGVKFYLEDSTGEILVDPAGADLDLEPSARLSTSLRAREKEFASGTFGADPQAPLVSEVALNQYAGALLEPRRRLPPGLGTLHGVLSWMLFRLGTIARPSGAYRFKESCLRPGFTHVVVGTCMENPHPRDEHDRNLIRKGRNNPIFLIRRGTEKKVESTIRVLSGCSVYAGALLILYSAVYLLYAFGLLHLPWK